MLPSCIGPGPDIVMLHKNVVKMHNAARSFFGTGKDVVASCKDWGLSFR